MQSDEAVDLAVEGCILAAAERHMAGGEDHPSGGTCHECAHCAEGCFLEAGDRLREELDAGYGICAYEGDEPRLVPLDQWHDWEDCWTGAA